jgi:hypothetical protein
MSKMCPDCGKPVATHAMFKSGRCPVVRVPRMSHVHPQQQRKTPPERGKD